MKKAFKVRIITTLSSTIEFYDFSLFLFLAPVLGQHFFPGSSRLGSIMPVLLVYCAGYLARVVGGFFYSHFGDSYGRKKSYMYSIIIISVANLAIAALPGQETWGLSAPALLFLLRVIQGLSLGGEVPGALTFAAEHSKSNRRGTVTGLIIAGLSFGTALASGVIAVLYLVLGEELIRAWGWRLAFVLGAVMGGISLWLRLSLSETPAYQQAQHETHAEKIPLKRLVHNHKMAIIRGMSIAMVPALCFSIMYYLPRLQGHFLHVSQNDTFSLNAVALLMLSMLALLSGYFSDKVGRVPMIKWGAVIVFVFFPVGMFLLVQGKLPGIVALIPLLISTAALNGTYEAAIIELFPTHSRYSGVAFCHNMSFGITLGVSPIILEWLSSHRLFYLIGLMPALFALWLFYLSLSWKEQNNQSLVNV